jgi:predicted aspartyl protease
MGTLRVRIQVGDAKLERFEPIEALVDTGATYTVLPRSLLRELGVVPHTRAPSSWRTVPRPALLMRAA